MSENIKKLTPLWKEYRSTLLPELGGESTSLLRVIPIQKKIISEAEILPYEKVYKMIDQAKVVGISHCACRELEQNCDSPREGCMLFDSTCTYLVERGFGRYLTNDEKPGVKVERCIGCGLCSTGCPEDAIHMERSVDMPEPPASYMELGLRLLQEKGKLEKFMEMNFPK